MAEFLKLIGKAGVDEAAPLAWGDRQKIPEFVHGKGPPFAGSIRLAARFDLGVGVYLDQAVPLGLVESRRPEWALSMSAMTRRA